MQSNLSRRWPPIVAAVIGALLVFLVLPNPLSIPQTNPSASAEYAPVPGNQQQAQTANFSATQGATSAGVGAGGEGIGALPGIPPPALPEFNPRQKSCVGNPPRQTEDPLSPPCVPFFEGKNGGSTARGVTKDEITIILYNDRCCDGDMNGPWKPSDEKWCDDKTIYPDECLNIVRTVKAHLKFFQRRYQTYGRTIRLVAQISSGNLSGTCASREQDAKTALERYDPFAVVYLNEANRKCYLDVMRAAGVAGFGEGFELSLAEYQERAPYAWGFFPGNEIRARWAASLICDSLRGEKAKYAGDETYHGLKRKFGFIRPEGDSRGPELRESADLLQKELKLQCGFTFPLVRTFNAAANDGAGAGAAEASNIISEFKREDVTSVICYCIAVPTENTVPTMQKTASSFDYYPEWVWPCCLTSETAHKTYGDRAQRSFGLTPIWRQPAFREQFHYQAYLQEEAGSQPNSRFSFTAYHLFLNLFQAIQAAGPKLTLETVEQGMYTFNWTDRNNPWVPTGGYGDYSGDAVAPFNFVDTAVGFWWDPAGTPPGSASADGCIRLIRQGQAFYAGEWPRDAGKGLWFNEDDPCTAAHWKSADPSVGGV